MATKSRADSPPTLDVVLRNLADRRIELDQLDDKLSSMIRKIEVVLRKHVSTRIEHQIAPGGYSDGAEYLVFGKLDGKFQLYLEFGHANLGEFEVDSTTALLNSSRETRTQVFADGHVEALIRSAHEQFSQQIEMRQRALVAAERIAAALGDIADPDAPDSDIPF